MYDEVTAYATTSLHMLLWYSFLAIVKVILIAAFGGFFTRARLLSPSAKKDFSNLVFYLFTPCLLFASVSTTVDAGSVLQWWPLVVFPMTWQVFAFVSGQLLARSVLPALAPASAMPLLSTSPASVPHLQRSKREEILKCLVSSLVFWNGGNLPLSLIISITRDIEPFASDPTATARGVAYTSITMTYMDILSWGVALNYLRPSTPPPTNQLDTDVDPAALRHSKHYATLDGYDDSEEKADMLGVASGEDVRANKSAVSNNGQLETVKDSPGVRFAKQLFTPVNIALVVALVVGLINPLKSTFHDVGAPLKFVSDLTITLGACTVPIILLVLGASLSNGPQALRISKWAIIGVILLKLVVMPILGIAMVWAANRWGLLPDDPLFCLCLVIQAASPSATALVVITELLDSGSGMMASLQFWQYLVAMCSITLFIALSLYLFL